VATRTALLVGASGLVGGHCLDALLADPAYTAVTVLGRRELGRQHAKLRQRVVDFDRQEEIGRAAAGDDVFCCLGTTIRTAGSQAAFRRVDFEYPVAVASAAAAAGARQLLIVSALGANPGAATFYSRVKGEVERAVAALRFRGVCVFRPSLLLGKREEFRLLERAALLVAAPLSLVLQGPLRRYRPIAASTVGAFMVRTAHRDLTGVHVFESEQIG
jgi:uncharacterized protein YbjT (DUF2867 family)